MAAKFKIGDSIRVRIRVASGHCRTPAYIQGKIGSVEAIHGTFPNPELRAYGSDGSPAQVLYLVSLDQPHTWKEPIELVTEAVHERTLQEEVEKMRQTGAEWLMQRGQKRGELQAKRKILLDLMTTKFGAVPPAVTAKSERLAAQGALRRSAEEGVYRQHHQGNRD